MKLWVSKVEAMRSAPSVTVSPLGSQI